MYCSYFQSTPVAEDPTKVIFKKYTGEDGKMYARELKHFLKEMAVLGKEEKIIEKYCNINIGDKSNNQIANKATKRKQRVIRMLLTTRTDTS